ncbi:sensor histidine kinase [Paenibacillus chartarius]|uniref:histidine kinase n=1 Tax=Paenibacillus chartarius TaxID=747481 RepID=A0ABV6DHA1_9BACL
MLGSWLKPTVRLQIWLGAVAVLIAVLSVTGSAAYQPIAELLRSHTDRYVHALTSHIHSSVEVSLSNVDTVTFQLVADSSMQELLYAIKYSESKEPTVEQRISAKLMVDEFRYYTASIVSIELYAGDKAVYPLQYASLRSRVDPEWIDAADRRPGELVWIGLDPKDGETLLSIRQIRLENDRFNAGGYLVVRVSKSIIPFYSANVPQIPDSYMYVFDSHGRMLVSTQTDVKQTPPGIFSNSNVVRMNGNTYVPIRIRSSVTGWTLVSLAPQHWIAEGMDVIKEALLWAGAIGLVLSVVLAHMLSTMITRPVRKLIRTMRSGKGGIPDRNHGTFRTLELSELNAAYNRMVDRVRELVETVYERELMQHQAEMQALQAQINPHFLYNSLETFYWLLKERGQEELAGTVIALSRMFRYAVRSPASGGEWVTVSDELNHVSQYMSLMLKRFDDRLTWSVEADPRAVNAVLPKLLLQPLVENAVCHGIEPAGQGAIKLRIVLSESGREVRFAVADNGCGMEQGFAEAILAGHPARSGDSKGTGIGLVNLHHRLRLYYGDGHGLQISSRRGSGTAVSFEIPYIIRSE